MVSMYHFVHCISSTHSLKYIQAFKLPQKYLIYHKTITYYTVTVHACLIYQIRHSACTTVQQAKSAILYNYSLNIGEAVLDINIASNVN